VFQAGGNGSATIPYAAVTFARIGAKGWSQSGVAIMISPIALFSKKRKHFLTISYKDTAGKEQASVFELGRTSSGPR
jgi:hypothetical protein